MSLININNPVISYGTFSPYICLIKSENKIIESSPSKTEIPRSLDICEKIYPNDIHRIPDFDTCPETDPRWEIIEKKLNRSNLVNYPMVDSGCNYKQQVKQIVEFTREKVQEEFKVTGLSQISCELDPSLKQEFTKLLKSNRIDRINCLRTMLYAKDFFSTGNAILNNPHLEKLFDDNIELNFTSVKTTQDVIEKIRLFLGFCRTKSEHLKKIIRITIQNQNLYSLPKLISFLPNLVKISLEGNNLASLPPEIVNLKNLKKLKLEQNKLKKFPVEILALSKLEVLDLSFNYIRCIPKEISQLKNLVRLDFQSNELQFIPHGIENLEKINHLNLNYNYELQSLPKIDTWVSSVKAVNEKIILLV